MIASSTGTIGGRQVKLLDVIDEFTREALAIVVDHTIGADDVVAVLERLAWQRGRPPAFVRFDKVQSSSRTPTAVAAWLAAVRDFVA